jgi:hypothetical protein
MTAAYYLITIWVQFNPKIWLRINTEASNPFKVTDYTREKMM